MSHEIPDDVQPFAYPGDVAPSPKSAKRRGLPTRKQWRYYSLWMQGYTHAQIARRYGTRRQRVTEVIGRLRERRPDLPRPRMCSARECSVDNHNLDRVKGASL